MITELHTETATVDLATGAAVLTATPSLTDPVLCQAYIECGDGANDLDGTGGDFTYVMTIGTQTAQSGPRAVVFSTAIRSSFWTAPFPVPETQEVIITLTSPNAGDAAVAVTSYLYDVTSTDSASVAAILLDTGTTIPAAITAVAAQVTTVDTVVDAIKAKTDNLPSSVPKNVALSYFAFSLFSSQDHVTPLAGEQ